MWRLGCGHPYTSHANFTRVRGRKGESAAGLQRSGVHRDDAPVAAAGLNSQWLRYFRARAEHWAHSSGQKLGCPPTADSLPTAETRRKRRGGGDGRGGGRERCPFVSGGKTRSAHSCSEGSVRSPEKRPCRACLRGVQRAREPVSVRLRGPAIPRAPPLGSRRGAGSAFPRPPGRRPRDPGLLPARPSRPAPSVGARRPRAGRGAAGAHLLDVLPHLRAVVADHQQLQSVIHEPVLRGQGEPSVRDRLRGKAPGGPAAGAAAAPATPPPASASPADARPGGAGAGEGRPRRRPRAEPFGHRAPHPQAAEKRWASGGDARPPPPRPPAA